MKFISAVRFDGGDFENIKKYQEIMRICMPFLSFDRFAPLSLIAEDAILTREQLTEIWQILINTERDLQGRKLGHQLELEQTNREMPLREHQEHIANVVAYEAKIQLILTAVNWIHLILSRLKEYGIAGMQKELELNRAGAVKVNEYYM